MKKLFRYEPSAPGLLFFKDIYERRYFLGLIPYWTQICHKMFDNDENVVNWINEYVKNGGDSSVKYVTVETKDTET